MGRNRASGGRTGSSDSYPPIMSSVGQVNEFEAKYEPWIGELTSLEIDSINEYTDSAFRTINRSLRTGEYMGDDTMNHISNIDYALARARLPQNVTVSRWISHRRIEGAAGDTIRDDGFVSTSLDGSFNWGKGHKTLIQVPRGYHAAAVERISAMGGEHELLLQRGTRFRIVRKGAGTADDPTILRVIP